MRSTILADRIGAKTMIDEQRRDLFIQIGNHRSPFQGMGTWPDLDNSFRSVSVALRSEHGFDYWNEVGGEVIGEGLSLRPDSKAAEDVILQIESEHGGFIWDNNNEKMAVRLMRSRKSGRRFGLAVNFEPSAGHNRLSELDEQDLTCAAQGVRLSTRAVQLLWFIHAEVMRQRKSLISLPDLVIRELIWGANHPKDWHRDLEMTLKSLTRLRIELLELNRPGWQPRLGSSSILLDHVDFPWNLGDLGGICDENCQLWNSPITHSHIRVGIGHAFLGVLEGCCTADHGHGREYNFKIKKEVRAKLESALPIAEALTRCKALGMSRDEQGVLNAVLAELTGDSFVSPIIQTGRLVPGSSCGRMEVCPLMDVNAEYVSFNGNGLRAGCGYTILGKRQTGWLYKVALNFDAISPLPATRRFLAALATLSTQLGFIVIGFIPNGSQWLDLAELNRIAMRRTGWKVLSLVHLRVYGPTDILKRLEGLFDANIQSDLALDDKSTRQLNQRLQYSGLTHEQIAAGLGVSRPFVTTLLNGRRPWPKTRIEQAEDLLLLVGDT